VHCKIVVVDGTIVYLGSANWTGAGLGAKGEGRRNFELGLLSRDDLLLDDVQAFFDAIWRGQPCTTASGATYARSRSVDGARAPLPADYCFAAVGESQCGLNLEIRLVGVAFRVEDREVVDVALGQPERIDSD